MQDETDSKLMQTLSAGKRYLAGQSALFQKFVTESPGAVRRWNMGKVEL